MRRPRSPLPIAKNHQRLYENYEGFLMRELTFDKGTLLLRGVDSKALEMGSSAFLWDSRVGAFRAPAYLYSQLKAGFGDLKDQVVISQAKPVLKQAPNLRPYQEAALSSWKLYGNRGIVVLPTGSGKTIVAVGAMAVLRTPTLILVPTRVLLEQWEEVLSKYFEGPIGVIGDGKRRLSSITVCTIESGYRFMSQIGNRFKLLIVDEIHHFGNGIRDEALEMSTCPYRLGLTATNVTKDTVQAKLRDTVGPTIYELTVSELKGKFLSPFELLTIQVDLTVQERKIYEASMETFRKAYLPFAQLHPDFDWVDFIRSAQKTFEGRQAHSAWQNARRIIHFPRAKEAMLDTVFGQHRENKVLIFTPDTATAYKIAKKHLIMPITSDIKRTEREEVLEKFRDGRLKALVSCRVLNEGIDVPDAEVAIIVGGNHGEREHIQRIGRCLRPAEGKRALVYELVVRDTMEVRHWERRTKSLDTRVIAQV